MPHPETTASEATSAISQQSLIQRIGQSLGSLGRNSIALCSADFAWKIAILYWTIAVGRIFGREALGAAELILSTGALLHLSTNLGLSTHLVKTLGQSPSREAISTARAALALKMVSSGLLYGAFFAIAVLLAPEHAELTTPLVIGCFFSSIAEFGFYFSRAYSRCGAESLSRILVSIGVYVLVTVAWALHLPLIAFAWIFAAAPTAYCILSTKQLKTLLGRVPWPRFSRETWTLLRQSISYGVTDLLGLAYLKIDIFLIGALVGIAELGIYAAPSRIILGFLFIPSLVMTVLLPQAGRMFHRDREAVLSRIGKVTATLIVLAGVIAIPGAYFSETLMVRLFGVEFARSGPILKILCTYLVFRFANTSLSTLLVIADRQRDRVRITLGSLALNVCLNLALIPSLGALGAAIATLISEVTLTILFYRACSRATGNLEPATRWIVFPMISIATLSCLPLLSLSAWFAIAALTGALLLGATFLLPRIPTMARRRKTVLVLRFSPGNRGDDVILTSLLHQLRKVVASGDLLVATRRPDLAPPITERIIEFRGAHPIGLVRFMGHLLACRALVLAGGTNLRESDRDKESYRPWKTMGSLPTAFVLSCMARWTNVPVALVSQGFHPIRLWPSRLLLKAILRMSGFVSVRDKASLEIAKPLSRTGLVLGADLAFSHPVARSRRSASGHPSEPSIRLGTPDLVGLSFRFALHGEARDRFTKSFGLGLEAALRPQDRLSCLVFSTQPDNPLEDDGVAFAELLRHLPRDHSRSAVIRKNWESAEELVLELQDLSLLFATRLHACILGLIARTPVIGIAYDEKVSSLLYEVGLSDYCIDPVALRDNPDLLRQATRRLRNALHTPAFRSRLEERIRAMERRSDRELYLFLTWLDPTRSSNSTTPWFKLQSPTFQPTPQPNVRSREQALNP